MGYKMTLEIPESVYQPLRASAEKAGRSPEEVVNAWLAKAVEALQQDPLLRWSGAFTAEVTDVADRHDDYLGQALLNELRGVGNE
jgi:hypothetical protein